LQAKAVNGKYAESTAYQLASDFKNGFHAIMVIKNSDVVPMSKEKSI